MGLDIELDPDLQEIIAKTRARLAGEGRLRPATGPFHSPFDDETRWAIVELVRSGEYHRLALDGAAEDPDLADLWSGDSPAHAGLNDDNLLLVLGGEMTTDKARALANGGPPRDYGVSSILPDLEGAIRPSVGDRDLHNATLGVPGRPPPLGPIATVSTRNARRRIPYDALCWDTC